MEEVQNITLTSTQFAQITSEIFERGDTEKVMSLVIKTVCKEHNLHQNWVPVLDCVCAIIMVNPKYKEWMNLVSKGQDFFLEQISSTGKAEFYANHN